MKKLRTLHVIAISLLLCIPLLAQSKSTDYAAELIAQERVGKTVTDFLNLWLWTLPPDILAIFYSPGTWYYEHQNDLLSPFNTKCTALQSVAKKYVNVAREIGGHSPELQTIGVQYGFYNGELKDDFARGNWNAESVVAAWTASPGHHFWMLEPSYNTVAVAQGGKIWVAVFAQHCPQ